MIPHRSPQFLRKSQLMKSRWGAGYVRMTGRPGRLWFMKYQWFFMMFI